MHWAQPLYIFIKPPLVVAREIDYRRRMLDIDRRYGVERFHFTVLPLGEGRDIAPTRLETLIRIVASLRAEPFRILLDTLSRNALVGQANGVRTLRKALKQHLVAAGLPVSDYDAPPHLSLTYCTEPERRQPVPPIGWIAEDFRLVRSIHGEGRHEDWAAGRWLPAKAS